MYGFQLQPLLSSICMPTYSWKSLDDSSTDISHSGCSLMRSFPRKLPPPLFLILIKNITCLLDLKIKPQFICNSPLPDIFNLPWNPLPCSHSSPSSTLLPILKQWFKPSLPLGLIAAKAIFFPPQVSSHSNISYLQLPVLPAKIQI